jgi:large subunit ribosomal protein L9
MAVKVILRQDVPNLGEAGDVKQVAPGYFRNFLLPRGMAVEASEGQLKALRATSKVKATKVSKSQEKAQGLAGRLSTLDLRFPVKVGEQGRLYGSITNKDIAEALSERAGTEIDRHKIELHEPLRSIGKHAVTVKLEHGVEATVEVDLIPETETESQT